MFDSIQNFIQDLSGSIWVFISLGIIAVVFLLFLVLGLLTGEQKKFKGAAKIFLHTPHEKTAFMSAKEMPLKVRKQFKSAKMSGAKFSDVITYDACVAEPYQKSIISKLVVATILATVFSLVLIFATLQFSRVGADHVALPVGLFLILAVGFLLIIIAAVVASLIKKGLNKTYETYVYELDNLSNAEFDSSSIEEPEVVMNKKQKKQKPSKEEARDMQSKAFMAGGPQPNQDTFNSPTSLNIELDSVGVIEEPNAQFVEADTTVSQNSEMGQFIVSEPAPAIIIQTTTTTTPSSPPPQPTNNIVNERAAVDAEVRRAVEEAERARKANASQGTTSRTETTTMVFETTSNNTSPQQDTSNAENIIQRIEKISKEGAPLATMKEVAMLLQQERSKPENKSPEQQQKLNAALSMLLKAMSTAGKK